MATRIVASVLGSALLLCALTGTASASATPECFTPDAWDRPGIERPHRLQCHRASSASLAGGPAHGRLTGFAFDAGSQIATWRYRPTTVRRPRTPSRCASTGPAAPRCSA